MKKGRLFINVINPLIMGGISYYLFFSDVLFVKKIDQFLTKPFHIHVSYGSTFVRLCRFYLLDYLWAYALMNLILLIIGANDRKIIVSILAFIILLELLQVFPFVAGTFDFWDLIVEMLASFLAIFLSRREECNEED